MEEETLAAIIGRRKLQGDDSIIKEKVCHISCSCYVFNAICLSFAFSISICNILLLLLVFSAPYLLLSSLSTDFL